MNKIQKKIETEIEYKKIFNVEITHTKKPLWDDTDERYILADSIENNPYNVTMVRVTGKHTHKLKLTESLLREVNEAIEDLCTPQATR